MPNVPSDVPSMAVTDYRDLMRALRKIEPTLATQVRKDIRKIASPMRNEVKDGIPSNAPLSGFVPKVIPGRLTWGTGKPAKSVVIDTRAPKVKPGKLTGSIVKLRVGSPGLVLADMAGKTNRYTDKKPYTREYPYSRSPNGMRKHKINGQGRAMIARLGKTASRYVWPAAEKSREATAQAIKGVLEQAYVRINDEMRTR